MQKLCAGGARLKFLFFWGHRPARSGETDRACLSNWYPSKFEVEGVEYGNAEQYMMAEKARLFEDNEMLGRILRARSPGAIKALGRQVRGFSEERWSARRFDLVAPGLNAKFSQNADLRRYLIGTKKRILVEASPKDRVWGIGLSKDDDRATHPPLWRGTNLLGFALMRVREAISTPG
ncbi:MAG: NADAR family protein [Myxococcales bacterium]|nr:NADAR family protein [Myxococcales bacterium]